MLHTYEDVLPDEFGELDSDTRRVNQGYLGLLTVRHVIAIVGQVVDAETPFVAAEI